MAFIGYYTFAVYFVDFACAGQVKEGVLCQDDCVTFGEFGYFNQYDI